MEEELWRSTTDPFLSALHAHRLQQRQPSQRQPRQTPLSTTHTGPTTRSQARSTQTAPVRGQQPYLKTKPGRWPYYVLYDQNDGGVFNIW